MTGNLFLHFLYWYVHNCVVLEYLLKVYHWHYTLICGTHDIIRTFDTHIIWLFLMSIMSYLIFTTIFALLILLNTASSPDCVTPTFDNGYNWFTLLKDSWHLSWTTFSTVGYGMIFPQAAGSHENKESSNTHCLGITILLSFESFVGITFVSFCANI